VRRDRQHLVVVAVVVGQEVLQHYLLHYLELLKMELLVLVARVAHL
jgi:hypothetical protein